MFHQRNWLGALALTGLMSVSGSLMAQDGSEGIARISDRAPVTTGGEVYQGGYGGDCYGDNCQHGHGRRGHGLFCDHYCSHSPDYGYSIPQKYPIHRRGVQYQNLFPAQWHGMPQTGTANVSYPMVYTPTDTTQLGFYYQHVPFWQPDPSRIPAKPIPAQWHYLAGPVSASNWSGCIHGHRRGACPQCQYGDATYGSPVPSTNGVSPTPLPSGSEMPPAPAPVPPSSVSNEVIRRAGY